MNVVIQVNGRDAIPVRAIPLLTDWEIMSPDKVAAVLAGEIRFQPAYRGLQAYRLVGEEVAAIRARWWENIASENLKELEVEIKERQSSAGTGYREWRQRSLMALPPSVFVWKDEYEQRYALAHRPRIGVAVTDDSPTDTSGDALIYLDFAPFVSDTETQQLVMEGFEPIRVNVMPDDAHQTALQRTTVVVNQTFLHVCVPNQAPLAQAASQPAPTGHPVLNSSKRPASPADAADTIGSCSVPGIEAPTVMQATPADDKIEAEKATGTYVDKGFVFKKRVLIQKHLHHWPSIVTDFQHSDTNGIRAAKATKFGEYFEKPLLDWARTNGKLTDEIHGSAAAQNSMFSLPGRRIKGV